MVNSEGTRRALLGAAVVGGVLVGGAARGEGGEASPQLTALKRKVRALGIAAQSLDYDDAAAEAEYYETARAIMEAVIVTPAPTIAGLQLKAEALTWCYGGRPALGDGASTADRIVASMLDDLLGSSARGA